jgi:hypothetical protein
MGRNFRDEIVAQAKALALTGYSTRKAAVELEILFPGEDTPAHPTLVEWRKELSEADHEELADNERRIALRADELVTAKLETLEGDLGKVRLPELVMAAGVYRDKIFKRLEPKHQPQAINTGGVLIILNAEKPDIIGEATEESLEVVEGEVVKGGGDER